ncbi:hypothetical protein DdX_17416 [Ditylenchus destructor]|uniref:Uncharacterized protein n=1 Tax=Ditylenchus destructor TaxID=166010 RepID=A0AAD4QTF5_9BILA|nr:hypothetical protein DdX_17416 [Ditylenchus destructor]
MNGMSEMEHFPQHSLDSEVGPLVRKSDVWSPLGYDTKIDVFKFLRPYDIRKFCVYVNKSWAFFCVENQRYIPHPRSVPRRIVEERFCIDEKQAYEQRIVDENIQRMNARRQELRQERRQTRRILFLWCLTFLIMLLPTWSCIVYLIVRINTQSEEGPTDDLLALCPFMVLSLVISYLGLKACCMHNPAVMDSYYYNGMEYIQKRRHWLIWMCVRLILVLAALSFTYLFPHLTPSTAVLWIAVTVIHIPECRKLLSWMNWTDDENLCLQPSVDNRHGLHCNCHVVLILVLTTSALMFGFFWRIRSGYIERVPIQRQFSKTTSVVAGTLTIGITLSFAYTMIYDLVYKSCDVVIEVDSNDSWTVIQHSIYNALMMAFSPFLLYYLRQRSYYQSNCDLLDFITNKITSSLLIILWIDEIIYKSHAARQILVPKICEQMGNGVICSLVPCLRHSHKFKCRPAQDLVGSELDWFLIDDHFIHSVVVGAACEFYPVMIVLLWIVTGRAEKKAEQIDRQNQELKTIRRPLKNVVVLVSRISGMERVESACSPMNVAFPLRASARLLAVICVISALECTLIELFYTLDADSWGTQTSIIVYNISAYLHYAFVLASILLSQEGLCIWSSRFVPPTKSTSVHDNRSGD